MFLKLWFYLNAKKDIYVCCVSYTHKISSNGWFLAIVSTTVETNDPHSEIKPGLDLLGPIEQKFVSISDLYEPNDDGTKSQIFITKSYDAYEKITGEKFDFSKVTRGLGQEDEENQ